MSGLNHRDRARRGVTAASVPSPERIAESTYAMWHDPTTYDPFRHGPPYLPLRTGSGKTAHTRGKLVASERLDLHTFCAEMCAEYGPDAPAELSVLLVWLRAASMIHQTHHWQTRGSAYYGDHQLFQRLYDESQAMIDGVAERAVGSVPDMGHMLVTPLTQAGQITRIIWAFYGGDMKQASAEKYPAISLDVERHLLDVIDILRARMEAANRLSMGTDNLIQDVADKHETFVYLLQQRTKTASSYNYERK